MVPTKGKETITQDDDALETNSKNENNDDFEIVNDVGDLYSNNLYDIKVGSVIKGRIIEITDDVIVVDINYKSEGIIPLEEFGRSFRNFRFKIGDKIDVFLEKIENNDGRVVLSKKKADYFFAMEKISESYTKNTPIKAYIVRRVKGGMQVDINGIHAFLPASQVDLTLRQDLDSFVGRELEMKVIKINRARNNIVLSRRAILEEERNKNRHIILQEITEGQIRKGKIKNITNFGAFVDLGGVDGLLHITDISWGRVNHPSEVLHVGQEIEVKILSYDKDAGKIALGLKQKTENPWIVINNKFKIGDKVKAKVVSMTDYGAFLELAEGIEGLVHISEMSWTKHIEHPSEIVKIGSIIEVIILAINQDEKKISLGIKQTQPNPWDRIEQEFPIGTKLKRKIKNVTDFGIFVEIIEGIDGLVHVSDFSWTKTYNNANDLFKKDEEVEVSVLNIDKENQKIALGIKQLQTNPSIEDEENQTVKKYINNQKKEIANLGDIIGDKI